MKGKRKKKLKLKPLMIIVSLVTIGVAAYILLATPERNYYDFAKCLTEKKLTEYGTEKCLFCQKQKRILGLDAFNKYFRDTGFYVQCDVNQPIGSLATEISLDKDIGITKDMSLLDVCSKLDIAKTPTWVINGKRYIGLLNIPKLAEISGCPIPAEYEGPLQPEVGGYTG